MLCAYTHTHVRIPMCTCVQADGFFPDSNEASCHHSPKTPQQSLGALPLHPACPCPAQHRCPSWHDQHKTGQSRMEKESHSPFNALQELTESHVLQTSQGWTARRSGCGERTDRQRDGIDAASTREASLCTALSRGELRPRPGKRHPCE